MPTTIDLRYDRLRVLFPAGPPHINDLMMLWLASEGGTGNTLNDRWYTMLLSKAGISAAPINDMWFDVLTNNGFTQDSLTDKEFAYWTAGAPALV